MSLNAPILVLPVHHQAAPVVLLLQRVPCRAEAAEAEAAVVVVASGESS